MVAPENIPAWRRVVESAWFQRGLLLAVFALLTSLTWRKWPDLLVDYGRELYVPWRLAEGDVLYRDIVHYYGPLGVTVNSWLFRVFGVGFDRLFLFNLALLAGFTVLLHRHLRRWADGVASTLATLVFLTGFAFGNFVFITNYNFITPYSHDTVYGTYLAFGVMLALVAHWRAPHAKWLALAGLCAGGAYLTKPETTLAAATAAVVGLLISAWMQVPQRDRRWSPIARRFSRETLVLGGASLVPLSLFTAWFVIRLGGSEGWLAIHSSWTSVFASSSLRASATNLLFTGWDDPAANLVKVLRAGGIEAALVLFLGVFALVAGRARIVQPGVAQAATIAYVGLVGSLAYFVWREPLIVGRGLPVTAALLVLWRFWNFVCAPDDNEEQIRAGLALLWSGFAATMLLKMLLNPRLEHYGFFQAMPATLDLLMFIAGDAPRLLRRHGGLWRVGLAGGATISGVFALALAVNSQRIWDFKTYPVGEGRDRFYTFAPTASPIGAMVESTRRLVLTTQPDAKTLTVFPEGVMLNYLLRLKVPVKTFEFVPPALTNFGQEELLARLDSNPPDLVVFLSRDLREFGSPVFGFDEASGQRIVKWVEPRYSVIGQFGGNPLNFRELGVVTMRRNARVPAPPPSH